MQVSIETTQGLERKMTIAVPGERVDTAENSRLQEAARSVNLKGFRKGKVPFKVVKSKFGKGVRQEVVGELMSQTYYEAIQQQKLKPRSIRLSAQRQSSLCVAVLQQQVLRIHSIHCQVLFYRHIHPYRLLWARWQ